MKFIDVDEILANVKQQLRSYDSAGLINDTDLLRWIDYVINYFGIGNYAEKDYVIEVENYKGELPKDFKKLWSASICEICDNKEGESNYHLSFGREYPYFIRDWSNKVCTDECDECRDETITYKTIAIESKLKLHHPRHICKRHLMKLNKRVSKDKCHTSCPNAYVNSYYEFNLDDNYLYLNFEEGVVHIQYFSIEKDENGYPKILDNEFVKNAIEYYLIFKVFEQLFINGDVDVEKRFITFKQLSDTALKEATFNLKLPEYTVYIEQMKQLPKSLEIYGKQLYSTYQGNKSRYF